MSTIVTRAGKGSPLTHDELDDNFTNLNSDKLENINSESIGDLSDVDLVTSAPVTNDALVYDGANWVPGAVTTGDPTKLVAAVKNVTAGTLDKGTPVHITGATGNTFHVIAARADTPSAMPAAGVLAQQLTANSDGDMIISGFINGVNTSGFTAGDEIYVGATGGYTNSAPTGEGNLIQKLGVVSVIDATNGAGLVQGAGRTNALPNLDNDQFFLGNASNVAEAVDFTAAVQNISINAVSQDPAPILNGSLNANTNDIINVGDFVVNGTVTGGDGFGVKFPAGIDLDGAGIVSSHNGSYQRVDLTGGMDIVSGSSGVYNSTFTNNSSSGNGLLTTIGTPGSATTAGNLINARVATTGGYATRLNVDYTGKITVNNAYSFPTADGTSGQVLTTDGLGNLTFTTVSGGGGGGLANVVEDTTPQLGGDLDVNGFNITDSSANEYWTIGDGNTAMLATAEAIGPWITTDYTYDGSKRIRPNGSAFKITLSTDVTGSNGRIRGNTKEASLDLNSYSLTTTGGGRGFIRDYHHWSDIRNTGSAAVTLAQVRGIEAAGATVRDDNVTISSYKGIVLTNGIEASNPTPATTTIVDSTGIEINSVFANTTPTGTVRSIHSTDATALMEHAGPVKIGAYTLPNTDGTSGYVLTTNGAGTVYWGAAGSGGGGSFSGDLVGNTLTDTVNGFIDVDRRLYIDDSSGVDQHLVDVRMNNTTNGSFFFNAQMDNQSSNTNLLRMRRDTDVAQNYRYYINANLPQISTGQTFAGFATKRESMRQVYYNSQTSSFGNFTESLVDYGSVGYVDTGPTVVPQRRNAFTSFGHGIDAQTAASTPYIFSQGGTLISGTFGMTNATNNAISRNIDCGRDVSVNTYTLFADVAWTGLGAGVWGSWDPFWGQPWKMTLTHTVSSFENLSGATTVTVNQAFAPNFLIASPYGGYILTGYTNTPAWANTGTRTLTLQKPSSGTNYYIYTIQYLGGNIIVKDWESFNI